MMKIQLLGTRNKVDFALYLAHTIASQGKRVLVVDSTLTNLYTKGIAQLEENESLFEIQSVEILCTAKDWESVRAKLIAEDEELSKYDCVIVDIDSIDIMLNNWGSFDETLYISDNDRYNISSDIDLLHRFLDETDNRPIRRIHFESSFNVPDGYIELLMNNRVEFTANSESIEFDEQSERLRMMMQHNQLIPYNKLTKDYKTLLNNLVVELFGLDLREVAKSAKPSIFGGFKKKAATETEHVS